VGLKSRAHFIYKGEAAYPFIVIMQTKKIIFLVFLFLGVTYCGTARGVFYGAGTVLDGIATDARTVGNWIR
jgi:hypothetical protein